MAKRHSLYGNMSLLGLGDFGAGWNPLWGAAIGGGISGITSMSYGHMADAKKVADRHFYGLSAGLIASALMYVKGSTRHLAMPSALGSFLVSGLPWLEQKLLGTVQAPVAALPPAAGTAGMGMARVHRLGGLGAARVHRLNGLGIANIAPQPAAVGTIPGVAGPSFAGTQIGARSRGPVSLLGPATAQSKQVQLLGGPSVHGLSSAYGATLLGGGR
jgi:hypothetical protein